MSKIAEQLDFTKEKLLAPVYHLNRVFPQSGASTATLTVAGGNETIFEIPVKPVNFTKSYLQFDVTIPAAPLAAGNLNYAHLNTVPYFRSVYLIQEEVCMLVNLMRHKLMLI